MRPHFLFIVSLMAYATSVQAHSLSAFYRAAKVIGTRIIRPGQIPVFMNEVGKIEHLSDDRKPKTIATMGLCGCIATVLYVQHDSSQTALMTHYARGLDQLHIQQLAQALQEVRAESIRQASFFVVGPGLYKRNFAVGENQEAVVVEPSCKDVERLLVDTVQSNLPALDIATRYIPYQNHLLPGKGLAEVAVKLGLNGSSLQVWSALQSTDITLQKQQ